MRFLFTSIRNAGHFNPLVPLLQACLRRGHEVAVASAPDLEPQATKAGALFFPVDHPGDAGLRPLWEKIPTLPPDQMNAFVLGEIFARAVAGAALPSMKKTIEAWRPDVVLREGSELAGAVAAEACGVPHARMGITLGKLDADMRGFVQTAVDELRGRVGLAPDPRMKMLDGTRYFTMFPRSLEDPASPGPLDAVRFHEPTDASEPAPLPEEWWPNAHGPLVYVTFGSVAGGMPNARGAYRAAIDAVADLDVRALLTVGRELDPDVLGPVPANVHVERWVPQREVLAHAAAVVLHGGSGTTIGTLAYGVPMVVVPLFADQPDNARRVAEVGAGIAVFDKPPAPATIRAAVRRVLDETQHRDVARRIAAEMAALPTVDETVEVLAAVAR